LFQRQLSTSGGHQLKLPFIAMASQPITEKPTNTAEHNEFGEDGDIKGSDVVADAATKGQAITGYENLTPWQTVKHFKMATALCFAAAFSAATDGYQIG
jgi:hypothetical protein